MNISRDNYEEYFLLYADDELSDSEKAEVLIFVKNNKDLEDEFRMIHHTILKPDVNMKLNNKSFLLRSASSFITKENYEEVFVLYHDNELSESEKAETENFILLHEELKNEFDLIGIARLTAAEDIIFADKNVLYKKQKAARVVPLMLWRKLAAAVFIVFVLWIVHLYVQKPTQLNKSIVHNIPVKKLPERNLNIPGQKIKDVQTVAVLKYKNVQKDKAELSSHKVLQQKNGINNTIVKTTIKKEEKPANRNIANDEPGKANEEDLAVNTETKSIARDEIPSKENIQPTKFAAQKIPVQNVNDVSPVYAQPASYIDDASAKNNNYVFYDVTTNEFKKTKVGGFLKKVRRVIVRSSPIGRLLTGDDHQVASK